MNAKEAEIVNEAFIKRPDTYNLALGGKGGDFKAASAKLHLLMEDKTGDWYIKFKTKCKQVANSSQRKIKFNRSIKEYYKTHKGHFANKTHSQQTKNKISTSRQGKYMGKNNSAFGTVWMIDLEHNKNLKVPKDQVDQYLQQGCVLGKIEKGKLHIKQHLTAEEKLHRKQLNRQKQLDNERYRKQTLGKKYCFINIQTNKRKYFREFELNSVDLSVWKPTWLQFDIEEIKNLRNNKISWKQIAKYYNTTYWSIYSWYIDNKHLF